MNPEDIIRAMQQQMNDGMQQSSSLTRQPTTAELDEFIDRCMEEHDLNPQMLFQQIVYKIQPPKGHATITSIPEGEIYSLVLDRIKQRFGGK